jgi:hypothetical protein
MEGKILFEDKLKLHKSNIEIYKDGILVKSINQFIPKKKITEVQLLKGTAGWLGFAKPVFMGIIQEKKVTQSYLNIKNNEINTLIDLFKKIGIKAKLV